MVMQEPNHHRLSAVPFPQSDSSKLDQVSHAGSDNDRTLIRVTGLIIALHLLHHKLGMAQQCVFSEAVEVQSRRRHSCLRGEETEVGQGHIFFVSEMLHSQNIKCMGVNGLMLIQHPRQLGSADVTQKQSLFILQIFSKLLTFSYQRLQHISPNINLNGLTKQFMVDFLTIN